MVLRLSVIEANSSLGVEERYHEGLQRIHWKISHSHPSGSSSYLLEVAIKAMNDIFEENGLVSN